MNIEEVRATALSQPGATEDMPFGDDIVTFRIGGKIFICLWLGVQDRRFAIKLTPERNEQLREQHDAIQPAYHFNKKHWSDIYYEQNLDRKLIETLIKESYELVLNSLPKKVIATIKN